MADNVTVTNPTPNSDYTVASDEVQVGGTQALAEVQFVKLVDGTLNGTAPIPGGSSGLKVDLTSTGANATALKVDGSAVTQPVSIAATVSENLAQIAGTATDVNSGTKSAGTQRIVIATDQPQLTNALKVDGSATTQPVSGTVTANQGTPAAAANRWPVTVSDGTNSMPTGDAIARGLFVKPGDGTTTITVKAASTAAVAADTAQVVALSPNSPLPAGTATIGRMLVAGADSLASTLTATINVEDGRNTLATSDVLNRRLLERILLTLSDMNRNLMILTAMTGNLPADAISTADPEMRFV